MVRRFVKQVYIPQKYENGDWRRASGQEAEGLFRRSIVPEIGELRCRDLKATHLRAVLRKLAGEAVPDRKVIAELSKAINEALEAAASADYNLDALPESKPEAEAC